MGKCVGVIGAFMLIFSAGDTAMATPPDYISHQRQFEEAAKVVTSVGTCKNMGFNVDDRPAVIKEISDRVLHDAVSGGIGLAFARSLLNDALRREQEDLNFLSSLPDDVRTNTQLLDHYRNTMSFWNDRCVAISEDALGGRYIRRTTPDNEAAVQQKQLDKAAAALSAIAASK